MKILFLVIIIAFTVLVAPDMKAFEPHSTGITMSVENFSLVTDENYRQQLRKYIAMGITSYDFACRCCQHGLFSTGDYPDDHRVE